MQTLSTTLSTTGFVRDAGRALNLDPSADSFALLFASRDGRVNVYVLWTRNEGQIATARIPSTEGTLSAHDAFGDPVTLRQQGDGWLVEFGHLPVYVVDTEPTSR
jgi:hypothetical protein